MTTSDPERIYEAVHDRYASAARNTFEPPMLWAERHRDRGRQPRTLRERRN